MTLETPDFKSIFEAETKLSPLKKGESFWRRVFYGADESDLAQLDKNPQDIDAMVRVIFAPSKFVAPRTGEIGRKFFVKVIVETARGSTEKSEWYYVTKNYPDTALKLAMDLYRKLVDALPKKSVIIDSRAQVKLLGAPQWPT